MEDLRLLPIHKYPKYMKKCCDIINEEWPRSESARMHSLQVSSDKLPTCFVLTSSDNVVGHCKLSRIPSIPDSCFLESVVIKKELRGRKLGTHLMLKVEEYCRDFLHLSYIHLSSKDKELFYEKLGYVKCEPISIFGGFVGNYVRPQARLPDNIHKKIILGNETNCKQNSVSPPPPPPLPMIKQQNGAIFNNQRKVYMVKKL